MSDRYRISIINISIASSGEGPEQYILSPNKMVTKCTQKYKDLEQNGKRFSFCLINLIGACGSNIPLLNWIMSMMFLISLF